MNLTNRLGKDKIIIVLTFTILLILYLAIAKLFFAPVGYYGSTEQPRFADPWIARSETLLSGGTLYLDTFTSTPPLTNFLLIIPSLVPIYFGNINPWSTLSYMIFFSFFNLPTALILLRMPGNKKSGLVVALLFLLNPLTFGNTVLRRQDESIVVFFLALALLLTLENRNVLAPLTIGLGLLTKLSAGLLIPVALWHKRDWRYLIIPVAVFIAVLAPFLITAGQSAIFWDFTRQDAQHPFQFGGVGLISLWNGLQSTDAQISLLPAAAIFVIGVGIVALVLVKKRYGIIEDLVLLTSAAFLLSPKLHTGYFSIFVMLIAPLIKSNKQVIFYFLFGVVALIADFYKWPIVDYKAALLLMIVTLLIMVYLALSIIKRSDLAPASVQTELDFS